jgi:hypothetical protein
MEKERTTIVAFTKEILPEFLPVKLELEIRNPRISKVHLFDRLFELGYERHQSEDIPPRQEVKEPLLNLLNKSHMEYSCFLAYSAGCIKGKYGAAISSNDYMKMIEEAAKVGKEYFLKR